MSAALDCASRCSRFLRLRFMMTVEIASGHPQQRDIFPHLLEYEPRQNNHIINRFNFISSPPAESLLWLALDVVHIVSEMDITPSDCGTPASQYYRQQWVILTKWLTLILIFKRCLLVTLFEDEVRVHRAVNTQFLRIWVFHQFRAWNKTFGHFGLY